MCMFTLYIVFHRNEEFHDDITTSVQIYIEELLNEVVQQLEETEGAQQQVWSVHVNGDWDHEKVGVAHDVKSPKNQPQFSQTTMWQLIKVRCVRKLGFIKSSHKLLQTTINFKGLIKSTETRNDG